YVRGLAAAAMRRGAALFQAAPVVAWRREGAAQLLVTPAGVVRARKGVGATNGYTPEARPPYVHARTPAVEGHIRVARSLADGREVGMGRTQVYSDTRKLLFYRRGLPDGRMLMGGRAGIFDTTSAIRARRQRLLDAIAEKWPVLRGVESEYFWHGNVCLSYDL